MYNLFLDDRRSPEEVSKTMSHPEIYINTNWVIVHSYDEFIKTIEKNGIPRAISLDHDLGDVNPGDPNHREKTGFHCAKWLIEYCIDHIKDIPKVVLIHSENQEGSRDIESLFKTYEKLYRRT